MKKLNLSIEEIAVSSFITDECDDGRGTVLGNEEKTALISCVRVCGTVIAADPDGCTSGCACCRYRPAARPQV